MQLNKNIFKLRNTSTQSQTESEDSMPMQSVFNEEDRKTHYFNEGQAKAQSLGGTPEVIRPQLEAVYRSVQQEIKRNEIEQERRKQPYKDKIANLEAQKNSVVTQKNQKEEDLKREENKIEECKKKISDIKNNPSIVTGVEGSNMPTIIIGGIILFFLTIYLFVFYSSAAYSAFFKEFNVSTLGIADAIFDAQAISKAYTDGFMSSVLVLTIPFIFLGLGFLLFKFSESEKGYIKVLKVLSLILLTFVFDCILAHEICSKIYNLKAENSFEDLPPYHLSMSFYNINFWLIIFSGFVVYLIWGLVFSTFMKAINPLHKVKIAIEDLEKRIAEYKVECKSIKAELLEINKRVGGIDADITRNKNILANTIVTKSDVFLEVNNFVSGWLSYMQYRQMDQAQRAKVVSIKDDFLATIESNFKY